MSDHTEDRDISEGETKNEGEASRKQSTTPSFRGEIDLFSAHMETISNVMVGMVLAVQELTSRAQKKLNSFEDKNCEIVVEGEDRTIRVPDSHFRAWRTLLRNYQHFELSREFVPRSLLVSVVSQYDAFLGRLLRAAFIRKPDILNGSERRLTFESLSQFKSLEEAREYILEKEVESVLRSSHNEQFRWMEKAFDLPLTRGLDTYPSFIELTERRNLFVHTDGVVSSQYLSVCRQHKCKLGDNLKEGSRLGVPQEYFQSAHACVYEIGVKLGHVLWRKLFPGEREAADDAFIALTYDLIDHGKYAIAARLLDFACQDFKKFYNEATQTILTVNRAQAYKWSGDGDKARRIMRSVDWSAKGDNFKLAEAVMRDDFAAAARFMRLIGPTGPVTRSHYRDWPLFRQFRKSNEFLATYQEVFGESFSRKSEVKEKNLPQVDAVHDEVKPLSESSEDAP